jgi:hypothetical protein
VKQIFSVDILKVGSVADVLHGGSVIKPAAYQSGAGGTYQIFADGAG